MWLSRDASSSSAYGGLAPRLRRTVPSTSQSVRQDDTQHALVWTPVDSDLCLGYTFLLNDDQAI